MVKKLYNELNLQKVFQDYEEESYKQLRQMIDNVQSVPTNVFLSLLHKIYKRRL